MAIINVFGAVGVGKTSFALEAPVRPATEDGKLRIAFFNFDVKEVDGADDFLFYQSYAHFFFPGKGLEVAACEAVWKDFSQLPNDLDLIVFDAYELWQKALPPFVDKNRDMIKSMWHGHGMFKKLELFGAATRLEGALLDLAQKKAKTVVVINHLTPEYDDKNKMTGDWLPVSSKAVVQKSAIRLWLVPSSNIVPNALVLKSNSVRMYNNEAGRIVTASVLPQFIASESAIGFSLWDKINEYEQNPAGLRELSVSEKMMAKELEMVSKAMNAFTHLDDLPERMEEIEGLREFLANHSGKPLPVLQKLTETEFGAKFDENTIKFHMEN